MSSHIGYLSIPTLSSKSLQLSHVICAPTMFRNIIYISQLCLDNNLLIEFSSDSYIMNDRLTGAHLIKGPTKQGIYELQNSPSILAFSTIKASAINWHHRLGHPSLAIFKHLVSDFNLDVSSSLSYSCDACYCNKSHKLSINKSTLISHAPLDIIYTDLWTSRIYSLDNFKYYVVFIDHFIKYIWFYPLKNKSEQIWFLFDLKP